MTQQEYNGLFGEVVTSDCYKLLSLNFTPDIVFDLGANVGIFSRYVQGLWPYAKIIAVEPHPSNIERYKSETVTWGDMVDPVLLEKAIGMGELYHNLGARNGSGEVYISKGLGYPEGGDERSAIATVMPSELIKKYWKPGMRSILKCDIEGAENSLWGHKPTMAALKKMDYIAIELHYYATTHLGVIEVMERTAQALKELEETHVVTKEHIHVWARKK